MSGRIVYQMKTEQDNVQFIAGCMSPHVRLLFLFLSIHLQFYHLGISLMVIGKVSLLS